VLLVVESGNGTVQGVSDSPLFVLSHRSLHKDKGSRSEIKVLVHASSFLHGCEQRDSGSKQGVERFMIALKGVTGVVLSPFLGSRCRFSATSSGISPCMHNDLFSFIRNYSLLTLSKTFKPQQLPSANAWRRFGLGRVTLNRYDPGADVKAAA
jgi:hypothetical protein